MNYRPALLGQVRLAQIPSWGPGTAPAPMLPIGQQAPAVGTDAAPPLETSVPLSSKVYAGGAIVAVMAAIGALLA